MWLPVIVKQGSQLGMGSVGLLNAGPYVIGAAVMVGIGKNLGSAPDSQAFRLAIHVFGSNRIRVFLYGRYSAFLAVVHRIDHRMHLHVRAVRPLLGHDPGNGFTNVVGESMALINTCGAAGGFVGTYGVGALYDLTHSYAASFGCLGIALAAAGFLTIAIRARGERGNTERGNSIAEVLQP